MNTPLSPDDIDALARKRAGAKLGWYVHALVYVVVNLFLFLTSQYALGNRNWSWGPLLGWGLGLFLHGVSVWFLGAGASFREHLVQRERDAIARNQNSR